MDQLVLYCTLFSEVQAHMAENTGLEGLYSREE